MSPSLRLVPLSAALVAAFACAAPVAAATAAGVVVGGDGLVYEHARVCVDRNANGRCDAGERAVMTGADGRFALKGGGPLVAEVGAGAWRVDRASGARTPVARALVFRGVATTAGAGGAAAAALGPLSTELRALADGGAADAAALLAARLDVPADALLQDPAALPDARQRAALAAEDAGLVGRIANAVDAAGSKGDRVAEIDKRLDLEELRNVVVIYAENRSFNNVFANFPGARGVHGAKLVAQKDRDGTPLEQLPPAWGGLTAAGQGVLVTQAQTTNVLPNAPFQIDAAHPAWGAPALGNEVVTRDLYHRFFENQMQIAGGANDRFAAWADSGGLVMGYFDGSHTALWRLARQYTLADNFFQGAFGGSFLNHQYLICACAPDYPDADTAPAHPSIAVLQTAADGRYEPALALAPNSPKSALAGPPVFQRSGNLTPKNYLGDGTFHAVNTMQPAFQPSANPPPAGDAAGRYADPAAATTLPVQTRATIGDMLDARHVSWAWYAGAWNATVADRSKVYKDDGDDFQSHHQPFNYYAALDPVAAPQQRAAHLKDYADLVKAAADGSLPAVAFYKPSGANNEHPGYASLAVGDAHIADLVAKLQAGPQWKHMLIVVTYDENGGQWDEVAPPHGDLVGPGTRIPAVIISPYARRGYVDHTQYDTGSIARFLTHRFALPELEGLKLRDDALVANGGRAMGDLSDALDARSRQQAGR